MGVTNGSVWPDSCSDERVDGMGIGFGTMNLTYEALVICVQESSDANRPSASELDDKEVLRAKVMLFGGWGIQILHSPSLGDKLLVSPLLSVEVNHPLCIPLKTCLVRNWRMICPFCSEACKQRSIPCVLRVLSGTAREKQAAPCGTARLCFFGFQKIFSIRVPAKI
jgi:hypothetical protein